MSYWVEVDGAEQGPLQPDDLRRLVVQGRIQSETLIRTEDGAEVPAAVLMDQLYPPRPGGGSAPAPKAAPIEWQRYLGLILVICMIIVFYLIGSCRGS